MQIDFLFPMESRLEFTLHNPYRTAYAKIREKAWPFSD